MAFQPTLNKFGVPLVPGQSGIGVLMPKLKYRFRVSMYNFGPTGSALQLTQQVVTAGRPNIQHNRTALSSVHIRLFPETVHTSPSWGSNGDRIDISRC
jgi:hypothetical protein